MMSSEIGYLLRKNKFLIEIRLSCSSKRNPTLIQFLRESKTYSENTVLNV